MARRAPPAVGRRRLGHYLTAVGIIGVLASLGTIIAAGRMVAVFDDDLQASTEVTLQAIDAASDSVEVLDALVATIEAQSGPVVTALRNSADGIESSAGTVDVAATLADEDIPESLDSIAVVLERLEGAVGAIDLALRGLSALPIGPDYDPEVGIDEVVADVRGQVEELARRVDEASSSFVDVADALERAPADLRNVADAVERLAEDLRVEGLIADYEVTLADARAVAVEGLDNVDTGSDWLVAAVIAMAVVFGLGQAGTIALGRHLATTSIATSPAEAESPE